MRGTELVWHRSSKCDSGHCVEVAWKRSSYCDSGTCVEVADLSGGVAVRDSKDPDGPVLSFTRDEWSAFLAGVKDNQFG